MDQPIVIGVGGFTSDVGKTTLLCELLRAFPGWEAITRLANATGVKLAWTHPREVFKDMIAQVPAWKDLQWTREARPLQLRFAGSRG